MADIPATLGFQFSSVVPFLELWHLLDNLSLPILVRRRDTAVGRRSFGLTHLVGRCNFWLASMGVWNLSEYLFE